MTQEDTNHNDRGHAKLGGSSAYRWMNCTGYAFLKETVPPQEPGEQAIIGTQTHELAELVTHNFLWQKMYGELKVPLEVINDMESNLTEEQIECAYKFRDIVWEKVFEKTVIGKAWGLETKLILSDDLQMSGFADLWCVHIDDKGRRCGWIVDYKNGYVEVPAVKNPQLAFYGLGLRNYIRKMGKDLDVIKMAIHQPRIYGQQWKEWSMTSKQADAWEKKFFKAAEDIYINHKPKYKAGDWCTFCECKAVCETYSKTTNQRMSLKLLNTDEIKLPAPDTVPLDKLVKAMEHQNLVDAWFKSVHQYLMSKLMLGEEVAGLKLVEGSSRRQWIEDESKIIQILSEAGATDLFNSKLKPLTSLEKVVGKNVIAQCVKLSTPKLALVTDSDPRPKAQNYLDKLKD